MFPASLLQKRSAMSNDASPAENDAESSQAEPLGKGNRSGRAAARYQYATGDTPLDGYTIKRAVGRGGFGEVYFATSEAGKEVALKLIRRNLDIELRGVRQCLNLKHPNLVALYDLRTDAADDQWVVMEYVTGESLEAAITRHPEGMPVEEALEWLRGIAAGVGYLHSNGIVHRDLKPGNIYLERGNDSIATRVKIGDYGLSKFMSNTRRSGQTESVGTVHYMAPEIAGGRYGREIDTYALGVILYEMLTGCLPFEGESVGEVLMKHLTAEPDLAKVDEPYRTIVARALAKDPELRLSSVEEMLAMLPGEKAPATYVDGSRGTTSQADAMSAVLRNKLNNEFEKPWSPVSRPPHTDFPKPPREPLWQYAVEVLDEGRQWWAQLPLPPLAKGVIFFAALVAFVFSGLAFAIPFTVLPAYFAWYIFWSIFLKEATPANPTGPVQPNGRRRKNCKPSASRQARYDWRAAALRQRRERTTRQKATTLTGSMLGSALVATILSAILAPLAVANTEATPLGFGVWLAVISTLGAWSVLASSALSARFFDGRGPRRMMNLPIGLALGVVAAALALLLGEGIVDRDLGFDKNDAVLTHLADEWIPIADNLRVVASGSPGTQTVFVSLLGSAAYFGLLLFALRWWNTTDYVRRHRWNTWTILAAAAGAWLVSLLTWYPQPAGMLVAGTMAAALQLASPWCSASQRATLARGAS